MSRPLILPPLQRTVGDAEEFARTAHSLQADETGDQYIRHLIRVVGKTSAKLVGLSGILSPKTVCEMLQIAWLHGVIEHTPYGSDHLRHEGLSESVVHGVFALSNTSGMPYLAFIAGIIAHAPHPVILVKLSDNEDNVDPERLEKLDAATQVACPLKSGPP